ncbi:1-phosphofructokinase family hexose kinase [Rubrobacter taiwanensis]|jgi:1-phosphofructokinase|uniref:1-phosphofructokinase family hexose kinase n=1 Tax=Rubrobacter taiwanensis TaxID=185139 RepID=A0A4R1BF58_9ACTN|nr:hexose kinase [Rubrobacter taiwanensis]TCJ15737.1 1-phosphofructokinase family hexose kinase [Rubrobacter taiwanensis]
MILTVTLNAAVDRTVVVPNLTLGHRHRAPENLTLAGGKGINVARGLKALGVPVLATGLAGGRNRDAIRDGLSEAAIPFDFVEIKGQSRTSTAIIDPTSGTQTEINEYGPRVLPEEAEEFARRFNFLLEYATAVVFAGSLPRDMEESFLARLIQDARGRELTTVVDSTPTVLRAALKANPSLVSPNQHEAESVVGFDFIEREDFPRGVRRLVELGAGRACITSPEGHSYLTLDGESVLAAHAPRVEPRSTIGSGDAYLAGLLAGLLHRELDPLEAIRLAAGCAAANAEMLGAGVFDPRRAEELAREVEVEILEGGTERDAV